MLTQSKFSFQMFDFQAVVSATIKECDSSEEQTTSYHILHPTSEHGDYEFFTNLSQEY